MLFPLTDTGRDVLSMDIFLLFMRQFDIGLFYTHLLLGHIRGQLVILIARDQVLLEDLNISW